jgi:dihydrofolate reductase
MVRKLKLQVQISVDGCIAGPNGEMDWLVWNWDDKLKKYVDKLTEPVDTILMGRKMTDSFISHWSDVMNKPDDPWNAFSKKMMETPCGNSMKWTIGNGTTTLQ